MSKFRKLLNIVTSCLIFVGSTPSYVLAMDENQPYAEDISPTTGKPWGKAEDSSLRNSLRMRYLEKNEFDYWLESGTQRLGKLKVPPRSKELYFVGFMSKDGMLQDFSSARSNYSIKPAESKLERKIEKNVFNAVSPNSNFHPIKPIRVEFKLNTDGGLTILTASYTYLSHLKTSCYPAKFINHVSASDAL